jgi:hypothetical protein
LNFDYNRGNTELIRKKLAYRNRRWENINKQQFQLAYYGKVSYAESLHMPVFEREFIFGLLLKTKEEENKAAEEARKNAKRKAASKPIFISSIS